MLASNSIDFTRQSIIDTPLVALLQWADTATSGSEGDYKPAAKRVAAIFLALALDRDLVLALNLALALALIGTRDLVRDCDRALALDRDCNLDLDLDRAREFEEIKILKSLDFSSLIAGLEALKPDIPDDNRLYRTHLTSLRKLN